jgi:hypothetical protein
VWCVEIGAYVDLLGFAPDRRRNRSRRDNDHINTERQEFTTQALGICPATAMLALLTKPASFSPASAARTFAAAAFTAASSVTSSTSGTKASPNSAASTLAIRCLVHAAEDTQAMRDQNLDDTPADAGGCSRDPDATPLGSWRVSLMANPAPHRSHRVRGAARPARPHSQGQKQMDHRSSPDRGRKRQ